MTCREEFIRFMARSGAPASGDFAARPGRETPCFVNPGSCLAQHGPRA